MKGSTVALIIVLIIIAAIAIWLFYPNGNGSYVTTPSVPSTSTTPAIPPFDQSISDGTTTVNFPSADFGLATNQQQILVQSTIPPCDANFNYCLYYIGTTYQNTNLETAGLRIERRPGLTTQTQCLNTEPNGYTGLTPEIATSSDYAVSVFSSLQNGAAGHSAMDAVYRLSYQGSCYEFETRIAQTDLANYPSGTLQEFTADDETTLQSELDAILNAITLPSGEQVAFPASVITQP